MRMKTYISGPLDANNYLVWDKDSGEAVLVDCSQYNEEIINDIKANRLKLKYILLTHGHFDHVLGVNEMAKATGAPVYVGRADTVLLENINEYGSLFGWNKLEPPRYDLVHKEGDSLSIGAMGITVIETPGHTEGGLCYLIENNLFSGDTLFRDSYGRTDLFGGNFGKIEHSLKELIFKLDDEIKVYPGHGESSTVGYEKKYNEINR